MHVTLIHNPKAGDEEASKKKLVSWIRDAGHEVEHRSTKDKKGKDKKGLLDGDLGDLVAVAGGDGTVGKIARQLIGKEIPLAVLPLGTANNIARSLGIEGEPRALIAGWNTALRQKFNAGIASGPWGKRHFLESAGHGLFTHVMVHKEHMPEGESADEELNRALRVFRNLLANYRAHELQVTLDGEDLSGNYLMLEAMNISHVGPNLCLAADADPGDDLLDFVLIREEDRQALDAFLSDTLDGGGEPPCFAARRGRRLQIAWEHSQIHLDDSCWPEELIEMADQTFEPGDTAGSLYVTLDDQSLQFLV